MFNALANCRLQIADCRVQFAIALNIECRVQQRVAECRESANENKNESEGESANENTNKIAIKQYAPVPHNTASFRLSIALTGCLGFLLVFRCPERKWYCL